MDQDSEDTQTFPSAGEPVFGTARSRDGTCSIQNSTARPWMETFVDIYSRHTFPTSQDLRRCNICYENAQAAQRCLSSMSVLIWLFCNLLFALFDLSKPRISDGRVLVIALQLYFYQPVRAQSSPGSKSFPEHYAIRSTQRKLAPSTPCWGHFFRLQTKECLVAHTSPGRGNKTSRHRSQ
ncbi:uncharacterized protein BDCG_07399 [Blastomyces dermatitidis ER-3]|uniref:Uncharacterized protein n=1 Tax=Ajellomyces dermatitidis (strain ER-3 / ATCC MYA-2586) TaxID=559297 RepID=A0ABP2F5F1_AJEDR|nr:uncharacterized protein BDCG_07399 [Blastomyces dermatitidis ER-3]EEQ92279.2 hypothetical protein BDCG_07399 [Blastomyces dermatitidis ER-3]